MPRYRVLIAPGVTHLIDAATEEEAKKKTRAEIAKGSVSPFYDDIYFDYETGVNIKEGVGKSLRQKLGRAETEAEENKILNDLMEQVQGTKGDIDREGVLQNAVGAKGYARNTKNQVALTPFGLRQLGLEVPTIELQDGTVIEQNVVIDERRFGLDTGDLADFSGIAGPVAHTIAAFMPQTRILKTVASLLGGRDRMARTFVAGTAGMTGKMNEEYLDTLEGFQLQDRDDLADLYKGEFILGSAGQFMFGETPGMIFKALLGKQAPKENQRAGFAAARNVAFSDVKKLDRQKGRILTDKEIEKAIKNGELVTLDKSRGGLPSRKVYEQKLPAQYQAIVEQVVGNARDKPNTKYFRASINRLLSSIKDENDQLAETISVSSKRGLDEQVANATEKLRLKERKVTNELRKLLDDIGEEVIQVRDYGNIPANRAFGEEVKKTMAKARKLVMDQSGERFHRLDQRFANFKGQRELFEVGADGQARIARDAAGNPILKSDLEYEQSVVINKAINNIVLKHLKKADEYLDLDSTKSVFQDLVPPGAELGSGVRGQLKRLIGNAIERAEKGDYSLLTIRNDIHFLNRFYRDVLETSDERQVVINIARMFDDTRPGVNNADSILTELEIDGMNQIELALGKDLRMQPALKKDLANALEELRDANKTFAQRMEPFDDQAIDDLISNSRNSAIQADEVYTKALINGKEDDLRRIFQALREYDDYIKIDPVQQKKDAAGNVIENFYESKLKSDLRNRLFSNAIRESTENELTDVNFTQFAKEMNRFEKEFGKFNLLFQDPVTGISTGGKVLDTINDLNKIGFNPKPKQLEKLVYDINARTRSRGLKASDSGEQLIASLKQLAKATDDRMRFESQRAIADLPNKTVDETVRAIFRPGQATLIRTLKKTVSDEVFNDIQQASMQKLLSKSIDMNGKGKITDLFRAQNLKTSLDSFGDETLDAMFGVETRRGLRDLQFSIDKLTAGEAGRGGAAGGLIAAGLSAAIVFQPLAQLPVLSALLVAKVMFSYPPFVRAMSRTDPGSIREASKVLSAALRQFGLRLVNGEVVPLTEGAVGLLNESLDRGATAVGISDQDVQEQADEGFGVFNNLRNRINELTRPIQPTPEVPQVQSPDLAQAQIPDPLSDERIEFAERVAGRPILG